MLFWGRLEGGLMPNDRILIGCKLLLFTTDLRCSIRDDELTQLGQYPAVRRVLRGWVLERRAG